MRRLLPIAVFAICGLMFSSLVAHADTFTYNLDAEFSGGAEPSGSKPWLTATFADIFANPGDLQPVAVGLTLSAGGLSAGEYVGGWYFNIDPGNSSILSFTYLGFPDDPAQAGPSASVSSQTNSQNADGASGAGFDLLFTFSGPEADTFAGGESVFYQIRGGGATASMFNYLNQPSVGQGDFFSAAQVLGIGGEGSGWIAAAQNTGPGPAPIPEPATLLLLGTGLSGLGFFARKRFSKN